MANGRTSRYEISIYPDGLIYKLISAKINGKRKPSKIILPKDYFQKWKEEAPSTRRWVSRYQGVPVVEGADEHGEIILVYYEE